MLQMFDIAAWPVNCIGLIRVWLLEVSGSASLGRDAQAQCVEPNEAFGIALVIGACIIFKRGYFLVKQTVV